MKIRLQSFTGGITLVDLAIIFAVLAVLGTPSFATGMLFSAFGVLFFVVVLAVLLFVRVLALLLRRDRQEPLQP